MSPTRRSMSRLGVDAIRSHVNHTAPAAVVHAKPPGRSRRSRARRAGRLDERAAARVDHTAEVAEPTPSLHFSASGVAGAWPRTEVTEQRGRRSVTEKHGFGSVTDEHGHHGSFSCLFFVLFRVDPVTDLIRVNPCRFVLIRDGEVRRSRRVPSGLVADRHGRWSPSNADADGHRKTRIRIGHG